MTHRTTRIPTSILAAAAGLLLAAAPAQADVLETPVERGANLASAAGWQAWSTTAADGTHRLQLRRPDGTVLTPDIPAFGAPVDPAIGTRGGADGVNTPASRRLSVVYSRCEGASSTAGCDVHALDLTTLREARVAALATRAYSETAPSLNLGNWGVVRRGGARPGTYSYSERRGVLRRLTPTLAREIAASPSRIALTYRSSRGYGVQVRAFSGRYVITVTAGLQREPLSLQVTRYRAGWLHAEAGVTRAFQTGRFRSSQPTVVREAPRTLPAGVRSAAGDASYPFQRYLDARGIVRLEPPIV